jgi:mono/diheme cytochrome c family protein
MRLMAVATRFAVVLAAVTPAAAQTPQASVTSSTAARAVLDQYCVTCHNDRMKANFGNLSLQGIELEDVTASAERLEKVVKKMRAGTMPPVGNRRPDTATYGSLRRWLEATLDEAALKHPNPGRTQSLHRLNRAEYQNAVRDLLDLEGINYSTLLPKDDASYGFDNIAGVLGMSPTHLEQYLNTARHVSRFAVGDVTLPPSGETQIIPPDLSQEGRLEEMPLGTRGGLKLQRYFPVDATYTIRFQAHTGVGLSEEESNFIEVAVDGERVFYEKMKQKPIRHTMTGADIQANTDWEINVPIRAGLRNLTVTFLQTTNGQLEDLLQPFMRPPGISSFRLTRMGGYSGPYVAQVSYIGPFHTTGSGDTSSRRKIFVCRPTTAAAEEPCARRILSSLARRAYRRPITEKDVAALMTFYAKGRVGGSFETGIQVALERLLASPDYLFRFQKDAPGHNGHPYRISDVDLASRLSFFLWSSIPDDRLLDVAAKGLLRDPKVLDQEVRRMLADPKAEAFVENFAGQWLRLRAIPGVDRNPQMFPDFDDNLRQAMRRETELFFGSVVHEDRSALDLVNADYTYLNERLAKHYGISNVYGSQFRRVPVTDQNRRGLLGHASILTVTAQANRTSPVARGKWILENLLGAPPPAPPPNVPLLEETDVKGTLRVRMEAHRKNPVCASCHTMMDPLGFAMENYDPLGQWRTTDEGLPVDATGAMPDGAKFDGVSGLRQALLARPDVFIETLTDKLMIYALGRGTEYYDAPAIRQIARDAAKHNYKFSRVILGIVNSMPFQMRAPAAAAN